MSETETKTGRRKKVKEEVVLECRWLHFDPLVAWRKGQAATLSITDGKKTDLYLVRPHFDQGAIDYWIIEKCRTTAPARWEATEYHIPTDFSSCDCRWGVYRPDQKPCRHRVCLAKAIVQLEASRLPDPATRTS